MAGITYYYLLNVDPRLITYKTHFRGKRGYQPSDKMELDSQKDYRF